MVGLSSNAYDRGMLLRKACRIAGQLDADWYAVHVETPSEAVSRVSTRDFVKLLDNINLAGDLGAETVWLKSDDIVTAMLDFAREHGVTKIVHRPHPSAALAPPAQGRRDQAAAQRSERFRRRDRRRRRRRRDGKRIMSTPSLRTRIRNVSLLLVVLVIALGLYALPRVYRLGGAIRETLHRNYISIEVAQHMHRGAAGAAAGRARRQCARDARRRARHLHALDGYRESRLHRAGRARAGARYRERAGGGCSTKSPPRRRRRATTRSSTSCTRG